MAFGRRRTVDGLTNVCVPVDAPMVGGLLPSKPPAPPLTSPTVASRLLPSAIHSRRTNRMIARSKLTLKHGDSPIFVAERPSIVRAQASRPRRVNGAETMVRLTRVPAPGYVSIDGDSVREYGTQAKNIVTVESVGG